MTTIRADEILVGDVVVARSFLRGDRRLLETAALRGLGNARVREAYSDPSDNGGVVVTVESRDVRRTFRVDGASRVVRVDDDDAGPVTAEIRERCQERYDEIDTDDQRQVANLHAMEILSLVYRLSSGKPSPVIVPVGWAPGDPHPLDVVIEDVETAATDALANVLVYLIDHGYDAQAIYARAYDHAAAETRRPS